MNFKLFIKYRGIRKFCKKHDIDNYIINKDGSINVNEYVNLNNIYTNPVIHRIPLKKISFKFNKVNGWFDCSGNNLTTLENSPKIINGYFNCYNNDLTTLLNGPENVSGHYFCQNNLLKDVYGFPEAFFNKEIQINGNPVWEILDIVRNYFTINIGKMGNEQIWRAQKSMQINNYIIRFIHLLNYNKVIRNQDTIIKDRLEESLYALGIEKFPVTLGRILTNQVDFQNYKLI